VDNANASLGEEFFHIAVRQPEPQIPAHHQQDHLGREPEAANAEDDTPREPEPPLRLIDPGSPPKPPFAQRNRAAGRHLT
jgi:hypothetical protein